MTHSEGVILYSGFEKAFMGLVTRFGLESPIALYDRAKCIEILMERDGMTHEEAEEFFSFNTEGAWVGEQTPAFFTPIDLEALRGFEETDGATSKEG